MHCSKCLQAPNAEAGLNACCCELTKLGLNCALSEQVNNTGYAAEVSNTVMLMADGSNDGEFIQTTIQKPVYGAIT